MKSEAKEALHEEVADERGEFEQCDVAIALSPILSAMTGIYAGK